MAYRINVPHFMVSMLPLSSIRARLAFWYAGLLLLVLMIVEPTIYVLQTNDHFNQINSYLQTTAQHLAKELEAGSFDPEIVKHHETPLELLGGSSVYIGVYNSNRSLLTASENASRFPLPASTLNDTPSYVNLPVDQGRVRLYTYPAAHNGQTIGYIQVGASLHALDFVHARLRGLIVSVSFLGVLAALIGGWLIASSALKPVTDMAHTAGAVALSGNFGQRLPVSSSGDELARLATAFNSMLDSLENVFEHQRRFVDDASHELRAPLTSIRGNLDFLMRSGNRLAEDEKRLIASDISAEVGRLMRLVNELLILARSDQGQTFEPEPVELDRVLMTAHRQLAPLFADKQVVLDEIQPVTVSGNVDHLRQLVTTLLDNAVKYTPPSGIIGMSIRADHEWAVLSVWDTGIGIAERDLPHVFDRFYRADLARKRDQGGTGLGLSIAKAIAESHGGSIRILSKVNEGTRVEVSLPLAKPV